MEGQVMISGPSYLVLDTRGGESLEGQVMMCWWFCGLASAIQAVCTRIAADGIEDCRKACGGHGYLSSSGLPEMLGNFLQQCTVEGKTAHDDVDMHAG